MIERLVINGVIKVIFCGENEEHFEHEKKQQKKQQQQKTGLQLATKLFKQHHYLDISP